LHLLGKIELARQTLNKDNKIMDFKAGKADKNLTEMDIPIYREGIFC
jgi:hypothetical protein